MKDILSIKKIVAIGIGAAVFMILGRFASIPTVVPNTYIETNYAFLALISVIYGPVVGFLVGFIGHTLKDLLAGGSPWFSWILGSGFLGLSIGLIANKLKVNEGEFKVKEIIIFNIVQILGNIIAWMVIAIGLDTIIYAEPFNKIYFQGITASILNAISVGVIGTILIYTYSKTRVKKGSLNRE